MTIEKVKAFSEGGIFIAGADSGLAALQGGRNTPKNRQLIDGIKITDVDIVMSNKTTFSGGYQDYRPGPWDVDQSGNTRALWVAGADDVQLTNLSIRYTEPLRKDWKDMIYVDVGTVNGLVMDQCSFGNADRVGSSADQVGRRR